VNTLTSDETTDALMAAFNKLEPMDRAIIYDLAVRFCRNIKARHPEAKFGITSAIELIACVGMGMNDNTIRLKR
jgi:hypothetical protein